jgi:hypothetical protein
MIRYLTALVIGSAFTCAGSAVAAEKKAGDAFASLPAPKTVQVNTDRAEVVLHATVQHPVGKPCIGEWGQRIQAFAGCSRAAGADATMARYFVFLVDVPTEEVYKALLKLGARPRVHYSMQEGRKRSGLTSRTTAKDYLQGDPVLLSVFWKEGDRWVEHAYQDFVKERVGVDGKPVEKPWTPSFVFHGSGAIHHSGTGCIACPCDCPGGIIADNRLPIYDPKPTVRFDLSKVPRAGTSVYVRIRVVSSH